MRRVLVVISRLLCMLLAYLVATFGVTAILLRAILDASYVDSEFWPVVLKGWSVAAPVMFLPATGLMVLAEAASVQRCRVYVLSAVAAISFFGVPFLFLAFFEPAGLLLVPAVLLAGAFAGTAYWAIAGRTAGNWLINPAIRASRS
jgi:hypothetical protein